MVQGVDAPMDAPRPRLMPDPQRLPGRAETGSLTQSAVGLGWQGRPAQTSPSKETLHDPLH